MPKTAKPAAKPAAKTAAKAKPAASKPEVATAELPAQPEAAPPAPPLEASTDNPAGLPMASFQWLEHVRALPEKPGAQSDTFNAQPGSISYFIDEDGRNMRVVCVDGAWAKQEKAK